jgi:hypothetical protein
VAAIPFQHPALLIVFVSSPLSQGLWCATASVGGPQLDRADLAVGASREDVLFLTTQVAETGSHLKEALRNRRRLKEALKAARAELNAIEAEVEVARLAADAAEDHRVGICFGRFLFLWPPSAGGGGSLISFILQTWRRGCLTSNERWGPTALRVRHGDVPRHPYNRGVSGRRGCGISFGPTGGSALCTARPCQGAVRAGVHRGASEALAAADA